MGNKVFYGNGCTLFPFLFYCTYNCSYNGIQCRRTITSISDGVNLLRFILYTYRAYLF